MTRIDRKALRTYRDELQTLLSEWADKHEMSIDIGRITYTDSSFRFKAEFVKRNASTVTPNTSARPYTGPVPKGCSHSWIGMRFRMTPRRAPYEVVGFKPNARKNSVIVRSELGTRYVMSPDAVRRYLGDV